MARVAVEWTHKEATKKNVQQQQRRWQQKQHFIIIYKHNVFMEFHVHSPYSINSAFAACFCLLILILQVWYSTFFIFELLMNIKICTTSELAENWNSQQNSWEIFTMPFLQGSTLLNIHSWLFFPGWEILLLLNKCQKKSTAYYASINGIFTNQFIDFTLLVHWHEFHFSVFWMNLAWRKHVLHANWFLLRKLLFFGFL